MKITIGFAVLLIVFCSAAPLYAQAPPPPAPEYQEQAPGAMPTPASPPQGPGYYERRVPGPSGEAIMADLIFVRPLSIVGLALGTVVSIIATPLAVASGTTPMVYDKLIAEPYNFTVCRPLGSGF